MVDKNGEVTIITVARSDVSDTLISCYTSLTIEKKLSIDCDVLFNMEQQVQRVLYAIYI